MRSEKLTFPGSHGGLLAARLDLPDGAPKATALFAHCFTCSKDLFAASRIAGELVRLGLAVFRFDFTGLGQSEGEFENTNFQSNIQDLLAAAVSLRERGTPANVLVGHSLGGSAVLAAASDLPEVRAVATIAAPADANHVTRTFTSHVDEIHRAGQARVTLGGREFTIKRQFLEDLEGQRLSERIAAMRKPLLIFHSPTDSVVSIENASAIFLAAKHPKSFISLDGADHLLTKREDAVYVASMLSAWASRYVTSEATLEASASNADPDAVTVSETHEGKFQQAVRSGRHNLLADEPVAQGGDDTGPGPYDFLSIALGACTSMTMRLYASHKKLPVDGISITVRHGKRYIADCNECAEEKSGNRAKVDHFERIIRIEGDLDAATRQKLLAIANKCPVHNTLERSSRIETREES